MMCCCRATVDSRDEVNSRDGLRKENDWVTCRLSKRLWKRGSAYDWKRRRTKAGSLSARINHGCVQPSCSAGVYRAKTTNAIRDTAARRMLPSSELRNATVVIAQETSKAESVTIHLREKYTI